MYGITPDTTIRGQHFLIDEGIAERLIQDVQKQHTVVEIGAGIGQITELLAQRSREVIALEIDPQFEQRLTDLSSDHQNIQIRMVDVLAVDFQNLFHEDALCVGSLPYHIVEPFFLKLSRIDPNRFQSGRFLIGARFANSISAKLGDMQFGKITILMRTFFKCAVVEMIPSVAFYPEPGTISALISVTVRSTEEYSQTDRIFARIFHTGRMIPLLKNAIMDVLVETSKLTQNQARERIAELKLPETMLRCPVDILATEDFITLEKALTATDI